MAVGDVYNVSFYGKFSYGPTTINTLQYRVTTVGTGDPAAALGTLAGAVVGPGMRQAASSQWEYMLCLTSRIKPLPPTLSFTSTAGAGVGALTGASSFPSSAIVLTKTTAFAGRKYRGRWYHAGVRDGDVANGVMTTGVDSTFADLLVAITSGLTGSGHSFLPVIYHRADQSTTDITGAIIRHIVRNQRRRQIGVGV